MTDTKTVQKKQSRFANYKAKIAEAYKQGYTDGWNSNVFGSFSERASAAIGYRKGIKDKSKDAKIRQKNNKYLKH